MQKNTRILSLLLIAVAFPAYAGEPNVELNYRVIEALRNVEEAKLPTPKQEEPSQAKPWVNPDTIITVEEKKQSIWSEMFSAIPWSSIEEGSDPEPPLAESQAAATVTVSPTPPKPWVNPDQQPQKQQAHSEQWQNPDELPMKLATPPKTHPNSNKRITVEGPPAFKQETRTGALYGWRTMLDFENAPQETEETPLTETEENILERERLLRTAQPNPEIRSIIAPVPEKLSQPQKATATAEAKISFIAPPRFIPEPHYKPTAPARVISQIKKTIVSPEQPQKEDAVSKPQTTKPTTTVNTPTTANIVPEPDPILQPTPASPVIKKSAESNIPPSTSSNKKQQFSILFKGTKTSLNEKTELTLKEIAAKALQHEKQRIRVIGYASENADRTNSARRISLQRAIAVRNFFIRSGLDSSRINVQVMGSDNKKREKDRVEVVFVQ